MKNIIKTIFLVSFIALFITTSCEKDDDFVNLTSTIQIPKSFKSTTEGDYIIIDIALSEKMSEDLILEGTFSTDDIASYINNEDYKQELEYSYDGKIWHKEINPKQVIFRRLTTELQVRVKTIDDKLPETTEKFELKFTPKNADAFTLTNELRTIKASVFDNEITKLPGQGVVMELEISSDYSDYKIMSIVKEAYTPFEKEIIDGKYKKPLEDALTTFKLLPPDVKVVKFEVLANPQSGLGGYVYNTIQDGTDKWSMGMNLGFAYFDTKTNKTISYNEDGVYGNVFIHELGHILTLNYTTQINKITSNSSCNTYWNQEGCSREDSHINKFHEMFYKTPVTNTPTHVSLYAKTNLEEDIAETFSHFVTQENIPASSSSNSGALQKLNMIKGRANLETLKPKLRAIYKLSLYDTDFIWARYIDKKGNRISCLDHKTLIEELMPERE